MRSIPLAMTWEMLSRGRWMLPGFAMIANALPLLILTALRLEGANVTEDPSWIINHVVMTQISMFIFGSAVFSAQGSPSRLYALPIPNTSIVTWQLLPGMAAVALHSVLSTVLLNALFDLSWPIWGPAMFVAVALASVQAVLWLTEKTAWIVWGLALVGGVLGLWLKSRYGETFSLPTHFWREVTAGEVATMLAFALLAYAMGVIGVARNRRGEPLPALGIVDWLNRVLDPAPEVGQPFASPSQAQFWFEWRKKGWVMPACVAFGMVMGFGCWLLFSRKPSDLLDGFVAGGALLSVMGLVGGLTLGNLGPNDANFEMGHFLATRPLTNTDVARTFLKTAAKSVLIAWLIWVGLFLVVYLVLRTTNLVDQATLLNEQRWWYFPATLLGSWIVAITGATAGLTGRSRPFVGLFFGSIALFIGAQLFAKFALIPQSRVPFHQGLVAALGLVFLLGTAWAFVAARRRALIGTSTIFAAAGVWVVLCSLVVLEAALHPGRTLLGSVFLAVFAIGLVTLIVAPLATAPLAVAWNRNR